MKFDSHIKITAAALKLLKSSCPRPNMCDAPLFKSPARIWVHDAQRSTFADNYSSAAIPGGRALYGYYIARWLPANSPMRAPLELLEWLFPFDLATGVAAVDVNQPWTHSHPEGQKYHFQRTPTDSHYEGYRKALGFIHFHTEQWVNHVKRVATARKNPLCRASQAETQQYMFEMSLALHCLQDSFSTAHTVRAADKDVAASNPGGAPPIVELTVYSQQNHAVHSDDDYTSGGLRTGSGRMAVEASADLISMGLVSIGSAGGLSGWDRFVAKWLPERIVRSVTR